MTNNFNDQDQETIMRKLQAPFPLSDIEFRIGSMNPDKTQGMALAYVTSRAIQNRLDEVFGIGGWSAKFREWRGKGVICTLSVKINGEWVSKEDGAEETEIEEVKGSLSNSFKRASVHYGIGRYLYRLEAQWVPIKQIGSGKNYKMLQQPKLPNWALPGGEEKSNPVPAQQYSYQPVPDNVVRMEDKKLGQAATDQQGDLCECSVCHKINVPANVKEFSTRKFGKSICYSCQKEGGGVQQKVSGNPIPRQHNEEALDDDEITF